jgi:hypothetical protein
MAKNHTITPVDHTRANRAQNAIDMAYEVDSTDTQIVDLLTDLMHLAKQQKLSFAKLLSMAQVHYSEENH